MATLHQKIAPRIHSLTSGNEGVTHGRSPIAVFACFILLLLVLAGGGRCDAADLKILFLPPPMEGTISLGIYDSAGKLVRVLHKEAEVSEFASALNGLVTKWDGNDDHGVPCPPGNYHARGFMVGDLDIDGVDFHGNDWVTEDNSPHICRITCIATKDDDKLYLKAIVPGGTESVFLVDTSGTDGETAEPRLVPAADAFSQSKAEVRVVSGTDRQSLTVQSKVESGTGATVKITSGPFTTDICAPPVKGVNGAVWTLTGTSVEESSSAGVIHTIATKPGDPVPVKIAASHTSDKVYILEENNAVQRLRGLEFTGTAPEPTVLFEKTIHFCDRFDQVASTLTFPDGKPFVSSSTVTLTLAPNPLFQGQPGKVDVKVATDEKGSFITTTDGLPLYRVSETPHLRWAVMGRPEGSAALTIFESDGAVVSEFKADHLDQMMAFDAGDVIVPAASASPTPNGKQDEEAAPSVTPGLQPSPSPAQPAPSQASPAPSVSGSH